MEQDFGGKMLEEVDVQSRSNTPDNLCHLGGRKLGDDAHYILYQSVRLHKHLLWDENKPVLSATVMLSIQGGIGAEVRIVRGSSL